MVTIKTGGPSSYDLVVKRVDYQPIFTLATNKQSVITMETGRGRGYVIISYHPNQSAG